MKAIFAFLCFIFVFTSLRAQQSIIHVTDEAGENLPYAVVQFGETKTIFGVTDTAGLLKAVDLKGDFRVIISYTGYEKDTIQLRFPVDSVIHIKLKASPQLETIVIQSLRSNQKIETAPVKVEVLGKEELDEESSIKPSGIASLIGDVSGIQIQQSSAVNGDANVRIQGLEGRYTQILRDGIPLYDGFSGSFGILSIPPLDLRQIELIKGSASTLYGGGAIGGLINLISKEPAYKTEAVATINQSTLNETNLNSFFARRNKRFGFTWYSGLTRQEAKDVDGDGLSDVAKNKSIVLRPQLFWYPDQQTKMILGYSLTAADIRGGDMQALKGSTDSIHRFFENNIYNRHTLTFFAERKFDKTQKNKLVLKSSVSSFKKYISGSEENIGAKQLDQYHELHLLHQSSSFGSIVAGVNINIRNFNFLPGTDTVAWTGMNHHTVGFFSQYDKEIFHHTQLEAGIRYDRHSRYGGFLLPHVAIAAKYGAHWGWRVGMGGGYKTPDVLSSSWRQIPFSNILPLDSSVKAEKSYGYNIECNYKKQWDEHTDLFINQAFFYTTIKYPIAANTYPNGKVSFNNDLKPVVTKGFDTYLRLHAEDLELYAGITYTIAKRLQEDESFQQLPYTPNLRAAFTAVWELEDRFRIGVEGSYNGRQYTLTHVPTPGYFFSAAMIAYNINKHLQIVVNGENLFDYRQNKKASINIGTLTNPVFEPLWAPIDGRVVNCCLKWKR